jgi:8-oxo-dGTP pyrophosphatase MutT (NUDIX family)
MSKITSAAILFCNVDDTIKILTGIESYYCYEHKESDPVYNSLLEKWEKPVDREEAALRCVQLSTEYNTRIQYTLPDKDHIVHYLCVTNHSKIGIIKGCIEKDETSLDAIKREIMEEVGIIIEPSRFYKSSVSFSRTIIYMVPINYFEMLSIEERIKERNDQLVGEIFDLRFRTVQEIKDSSYDMNSVTKYICYHIHKLYFNQTTKHDKEIRLSSPRQTETYPYVPIVPLYDSWKWENGVRESLLELHM